MKVHVMAVTMLACAASTLAFADQSAPNRIARRAQSDGGEIAREQSRPANNNSVREAVKDAIAESLFVPVKDQRKQNAFYSDSPSLYGFSRGLMTLVTSPGNLIWAPCKLYKETGEAAVIIASPVVALMGIFPLIGDVLEGTLDVLSFGSFGDAHYIESGRRTWMYEWLSDPAPIDGFRDKAENEALRGSK